MKKQPLPDSVKQEACQALQMAAISSMAECSKFDPSELIFHGGTSLHLMYGSPRFSIDLDFMLSEERIGKSLDGLLDKTFHRMKQIFAIQDPDAVLEISNVRQSGTGVNDCWIKWSHPKYHGKARLKLEFYPVALNLLDEYPSEPRQSKQDTTGGGFKVLMNSPLPTGDMEAIFADKVFAGASRNYIKWRDFFDMWWIDQSMNGKAAQSEQFIENIINNCKIYKGDNSGELSLLVERLHHIVENLPVDKMFEAAKKDLKPFLPESVWKAYFPDTIKKVCQRSIEICADARDIIQAHIDRNHDFDMNNPGM